MSDLLVIEWDRSHLLVAQGSARSNSVKISKAVSVDRESGETPGELGQSLKRALSTSGIAAGEAIVVLPRQLVTIHRVTLPNISDDEIPTMARLQAATRLTVPVESVCLDFVPLPLKAGENTRDILLVSVPQKYVNDVRTTLQTAGLQLTGVRVSSFGIAASAVHSGLLHDGDGQNQVDVIAGLRSDSIDLVFMAQDSVLFTHSGASWSSPDGIEQTVRSELSRARLSAAEDLGEYTVRRLTLIGSPDVTSAVPDTISKRLNNAPVARVSPEETLFGGQVPDGTNPSDLLAVAGVISNCQQSSVAAVDLINPRKEREKKDYSRARNLLIAGTAALALTGGWKWRSEKVAGIEKEINVVAGETEDIEGAYRLAKNELLLDSRLTEWTDRDINWLAELEKIRTLMGGTEDVYIRRLKFGLRKGDYLAVVEAEGFARSRRDIEDLMRVLTDAGYEVAPTEIKTSARDAGYPMELSLEVSIPVPVSQPASKKA